MDIQQKEKESLAAYIHHFVHGKLADVNLIMMLHNYQNFYKRAQKCTHPSNQDLWEGTTKPGRHHKGGWKTSSCPTINIYLITTIIGKYHVQVMMINAFNAKKLSTWHAIAPHIRCFYCDNYCHVTADCPNKIPPSGIPTQSREEWH